MSLPLLLIGLVEFGLRVAGTGYPTGFLVPHPEKAGYLVDNYKFAWRFFPPALARTPQPIVVQKKKPAKTVRILVFGGSAAMGDPEVAYGMPRMLEVLLEGRFPQQDFEVINCAVTAINSHVVLSIAKDCRALNADAWIVYLGNNEVHGPFGAGTVFGARNQPRWLTRSTLALKKTKLGQAAFRLRQGTSNDNAPKQWGGMEMFLDQKVRHDDMRLESAYQNFAANLRDVANTANGNTRVFLSTVVTNTQDFPPFVSLHRDLDPEQIGAWDRACKEGVAAKNAGDYELALREFAEAEAIDDSFAELAYQLGQCLLKLGRSKEAREKLKRARDFDALRFRADTRINRIIRETPANERVELVDAELAFEQIAESGVIGSEFLYEHVHFTARGNYELAKLFGERVTQQLDFVKADARSDWASLEECKERLGWTPFHERLTLQDVSGRLNAPPFSTLSNRTQRTLELQEHANELGKQLTPQLGKETIASYSRMLEQNPDRWILRQQLGLLLDSVGDRAGAAEQFREVTRVLPHRPEPYFRLGAQYNRLRSWAEAERALRKAVELRPDFARAYNSLGICLSHQEEFDGSYRQFARAVQLQPSFAEAFYNWGLVLANQNDMEEAKSKFEAALSADPNYGPAKKKLGLP